jgi:hypothetical protein
MTRPPASRPRALSYLAAVVVVLGLPVGVSVLYPHMTPWLLGLAVVLLVIGGVGLWLSQAPVERRRGDAA